MKRILFLSTLFLSALFAQSKPQPDSPGGDPPKPPAVQAPKNIELNSEQELDFFRLFRSAADADNTFHVVADNYKSQVEARDDFKAARAKAQLTRDAFEEHVNQLLLKVGCRDCRIAYHENGKPYLTNSDQKAQPNPTPASPANPKPGDPKK